MKGLCLVDKGSACLVFMACVSRQGRSSRLLGRRRQRRHEILEKESPITKALVTIKPPGGFCTHHVDDEVFRGHGVVFGQQSLHQWSESEGKVCWLANVDVRAFFGQFFVHH